MEECQTTPIKNTGLRNVVIASTRISDVIGDEGKLIYRGYRIEDLAENASFEEVTHLLLKERLPGKADLADFSGALARERAIPDSVIAALKTRPPEALPMDVLQAGAAMLGHHDPDVNADARDAAERISIRLVARLATLLAAWERIRNGRTPVDPDPSLGHAENFLYMLTGERPSAEVARFMDVCLVLHAEHSFNASTFAAREVASTRAHMYASVAAAIGSLSGALHGGANTRVMRMLKEIGEVGRIDDYIAKQLDGGGKIMGLGHAVYKTDDPRAIILAPMSKRMGELAGDTRWYEISRELEQKAKAAFEARKNLKIYANVDFYSASLYYSMGIPMDMFTPIFAVSRVSGWTAHVLEEQFADAAPKPMLYRPESEYVGDYCGPEECRWEPLDNR